MKHYVDLRPAFGADRHRVGLAYRIEPSRLEDAAIPVNHQVRTLEGFAQPGGGLADDLLADLRLFAEDAQHVIGTSDG